MYDQVSSCVRVYDMLSDWFDIKSGVKQGCVLLPTLFDILINDLDDEIDSQCMGANIDVSHIMDLFFQMTLVLGEYE